MNVRPTVSIADEAANWLARHDRGLSARESAEFAAWCEADWRNAEEYRRLQQDWAQLEGARAHPELAAEARSLDHLTKPRPHAVPRRYSLHVGWGGALAAALIVAAFVLGVGTGRRAPAERAVAAYEVIPSAARQMTLKDGSVVELRGDSEVAVAFTDGERSVELVRGEAHFSVAKDASRPFVVRVGGVAVSAVGTAFNIRRDTAAVEVLVTEGRVRVQDAAGRQPLIQSQGEDPEPLLHAGQRVTVDLMPVIDVSAEPAKPAEIQAVRAAEIDQVLAWQKTRLMFVRTPLVEAVKAFNLHGNHRLEIGDSNLGTQLLGGTFLADNVEAFVRLLEQGGEVRAERFSDRTVLHATE